MSETTQGFGLSFQQERLWNLALSTEEPLGARLTILLEGEIDPPVLRAAVHRVVERHEILRTRFSPVPGLKLPVQVIAAASTALSWREDGDGTFAAPDAPVGPATEPVMHARLERLRDDLHRFTRVNVDVAILQQQSAANSAQVRV